LYKLWFHILFNQLKKSYQYNTNSVLSRATTTGNSSRQSYGFQGNSNNNKTAVASVAAHEKNYNNQEPMALLILNGMEYFL
jgi:hypothetical protein